MLTPPWPPNSTLARAGETAVEVQLIRATANIERGGRGGIDRRMRRECSPIFPEACSLCDVDGPRRESPSKVQGPGRRQGYRLAK